MRPRATYPEVFRRATLSCCARHVQRTSLFGLAPGGVYLADPVTRTTGERLPHPFTFTGKQRRFEVTAPSGAGRRRCAALLARAPFPPLSTGVPAGHGVPRGKKPRGLADCFLWHFPASHLDRPLAGTLPFGARTFLSSSGKTSDRPCHFNTFSLSVRPRRRGVPRGGRNARNAGNCAGPAPSARRPRAGAEHATGTRCSGHPPPTRWPCRHSVA